MSALREYKRNFWVASFASAIRSFGIGATWPFLAIFMTINLKIPIIEVGVIFGAMAAVSIVFSIVGGYLGDILGRKISILIGSFIGFISYFLVFIFFAEGASSLLISLIFIFSSVSGALVFPASSAVVADTTSEEMRRSAFGVYRIFGNLGWAIGPIIGSTVYDYGVGYIFLFSAISSAIQFLTVLIFMKDMKLRFTDVNRGKGFVSFDTNLLIFSFGTLFLTILTSQFNVTFPTYANIQGGVPASYIGYIYAVNGTVVVVGQLPMNVVFRKISDLNAMQIGAVVYAIGYFLSALSHGVVDFMGVMVIITIGENFTSPGISSIVTKIAPADKIGRYNGFNSMMNATARGIGPSVGSFFLYIYSYNGVKTWTSLDLFAVLAILLFIILNNKIKNDKDVNANIA
ncbi:MDR family MFS transporter [Cuniculiplasma sp. SKW4]|uniref:MDR family MFS transporter n=1 Tax=Cuniculiplasma sp. SKW4 TaxID=3400171 RepID=UPI003FD4CB4A